MQTLWLANILRFLHTLCRKREADRERASSLFFAIGIKVFGNLVRVRRFSRLVGRVVVASRSAPPLSLPQSLSLPLSLPQSQLPSLPFSSWTAALLFAFFASSVFANCCAQISARVRSKIHKAKKKNKIHKSCCPCLRRLSRQLRAFRAALLTYFLASRTLVTILL